MTYWNARLMTSSTRPAVLTRASIRRMYLCTCTTTSHLIRCSMQQIQCEYKAPFTRHNYYPIEGEVRYNVNCLFSLTTRFVVKHASWRSSNQGRRRGWKDGRVHCVVNQYFATKFWGGPMLESQKLVGSWPVQPMRWLRLCIQCIHYSFLLAFAMH